MSKTQRLFDLIAYVNTKKQFTANDVAVEFGISIRTAHRYLLELDSMGVPLYTEPGRNGGYRVLSRRVLPPIIFSEDEALAIFFAFQSLQYFKSLPFEVDITSASRKLYCSLPNDLKPQVENLKSTLIFWNRKREIETPLLKELIENAAQKNTIKILYQSPEGTVYRSIFPIGVYSSVGIWYMPAFDYEKRSVRLFRADRVVAIEKAAGDLEPPEEDLSDVLNTYKMKNPLHLYVKLSDRGVTQCKDNPYFETDVQNSIDSPGGYIDTTIDNADLEFAGKFFMSLGKDAQVIEPLEMKEWIISFAQKTLEQYT